MIKRVLKEQLRKTGMVKELEKENQELKNQIKDLDKEIENLSERVKISGHGPKRNLRGVSPDEGKPAILRFILENIKKDAKILDVGFGSGIYGKLLRAFYYQNIDGIDAYGKNIKETGLDIIYDNIFIENILDFNFEYYDLIIMGDVLEHIELESAKKLLLNFIDAKKCSAIVVSIPYEYEQDELYGNIHEKHLQPDVTASYMEKHYPYLKLIETSIMAHSKSVIAVYVWYEEERSLIHDDKSSKTLH